MGEDGGVRKNGHDGWMDGWMEGGKPGWGARWLATEAAIARCQEPVPSRGQWKELKTTMEQAEDAKQAMNIVNRPNAMDLPFKRWSDRKSTG